MHFCYVLYSSNLDKYYIGSTSDQLEERLRKHNSNHKGFTGSVNDWLIMYFEEFTDLKLARKREREIKAKKSRTFIEKLITKH